MITMSQKNSVVTQEQNDCYIVLWRAINYHARNSEDSVYLRST